MSRLLQFQLATVALLLALASATPGQTAWTAGIADWSTPGNWTLGVPNAASGTTFDALIANGGTAQLTTAGGSVRRLRVGLVGGPGSLVVDGGTLAVTENLHLNEGSSGPASVTVQNGATVTSPSTIVGFSSTPNTSMLISGAGTTFNASTQFIVGQSGAGTASLTVESGAVLTGGIGYLGNLAGSRGVGVVRNPGSRWSSVGQFAVGNLGVGTLTIEDQGVVSAGTNLFIAATSNVNLNGGTLRFNTVTNANRINYTAGTIQLGGNRDFSNDATIGALFPSSTIPVGKKLVVEGTGTIQIATEIVDGGEFVTNGGLNVSSTFAGYLRVLNAGKAVTGGDASIGLGFAPGLNLVSGVGSSWNIGGNLTIGSADLTIADQGTVYVGGAVSFTTATAGNDIRLNGGTLRFSSYSNPSRITYTSGTIQLSGDRSLGGDPAIAGFFGGQPTIPGAKQLTVEGTAMIPASSQLTLAGGTLSAGTVLMAPGSRLVSTTASQVVGPMLALAGSTIDATLADLTLGDATKVNGFYDAGTLRVGQRTVTLADSNDAVFDSSALVTLGAGGSPGTLAAANGLTLDFGANVTGFGTVDTPNDVAKPLINNGHITGESAGAPITLPGYVKGVGTFDNVSFTGTFAPGLSPTNLQVGNISLSPTSTLVMELGGTTPGSGYDQLTSSGTLTIDGTLELALINGFVPTPGQTFDIFSGGSMVGAFSALVLPEVPGLTWDTSQLEVGLLSVGISGDYNDDGVVNAADYTVWRDNLGNATALPNDDTPGVAADDYTRWVTNYGSATAVAVPEPNAALLAVGAVVSLLTPRGGGPSRTPRAGSVG